MLACRERAKGNGMGGGMGIGWMGYDRRAAKEGGKGSYSGEDKYALLGILKFRPCLTPTPHPHPHLTPPPGNEEKAKR